MVIDLYKTERIARRAMTTIATGFNPWYGWVYIGLITPEWVKQKIVFYPARVISILPNPSIHGLTPEADTVKIVPIVAKARWA
jgi:hypothetical protein